jgi:hypothetical protein
MVTFIFRFKISESKSQYIVVNKDRIKYFNF